MTTKTKTYNIAAIFTYFLIAALFMIEIILLIKLL
jgi:hypothetical protein